MKHYNELLKLGVFSKSQVNVLVGNSDTAKTLLKDYLQRGLIEKIRYNYYAVISLETKQSVSNRYMIASHINENAYVSHISAFEYYGLTNQAFTEVQVSSSKPFANFSYDGVNYIWISSAFEAGIVSFPSQIHVTDLERTIVDCIDDFEKIGGLEELLRCLQMITFIDEEKLLSYLESYNKQFLYQKTGYILLNFKDSMKLSQGFFSTCKKKISKSIRYLYKGIQYENPKYDSEWQIFVPKELLKWLDEGGDELV